MLPSEALMVISVWIPSVNIRPRVERAVALDSFSAQPLAQIEQGSPPCMLIDKHTMMTGYAVKDHLIHLFLVNEP